MAVMESAMQRLIVVGGEQDAECERGQVAVHDITISSRVITRHTLSHFRLQLRERSTHPHRHIVNAPPPTAESVFYYY